MLNKPWTAGDVHFWASSYEIRKIDKGNIRELWPHEQYDFSSPVLFPGLGVRGFSVMNAF